MYLPMGHPAAGSEPDLSGHGHDGTYLPRGDLPATTTLPNGDCAAMFDGRRQYAEVTSAPTLSVSRTERLTVQAWIRPDTLQFPSGQGSGYVYPLGKGTAGRQEYALRMYSRANAERPPRPNRIAAYAFNLAGGLGSGAYFQDRVTAGQWILVTFVIDAAASPAWPDGYIAIYKDTRRRGLVSLAQFHVRPGASTAPFRIATRDLASYFEGAIAKVAVYDHVIDGSQIAATYRAMYAR
jgi:hypothetical protein